VYALREAENGRAVNEIFRELGVSDVTFIPGDVPPILSSTEV